MRKSATAADGILEESEPPSLLEVLVANETGTDVNVELVENAVRTALRGSLFEEGMVSVAVVDDSTIHGLNRQYLTHDYPTDVLSFVLEGDPPRLIGEIIVSVDTATRMAAEAGWSAADELLLYVIHGTLHLTGHGDNTPETAAKMRAAELAVLVRIGISPSPRESRWRTGASAEDASP